MNYGHGEGLESVNITWTKPPVKIVYQMIVRFIQTCNLDNVIKCKIITLRCFLLISQTQSVGDSEREKVHVHTPCHFHLYHHRQVDFLPHGSSLEYPHHHIESWKLFPLLGFLLCIALCKRLRVIPSYCFKWPGFVPHCIL